MTTISQVSNAMQKILQHQQAEPPAVESLRSDLPAGLTAVLKRALAKNPEDRFQTPASLAIALRPFCRVDAAPAPPPARAGTAEQRRPADPTLHGTAHAFADTAPLSAKKPS